MILLLNKNPTSHVIWKNLVSRNFSKIEKMSLGAALRSSASFETILSEKYAQLFELLSGKDMEKPSKYTKFCFFFRKNLVTHNLLGFSILKLIFSTYLIVPLS